MKSSKIILSIGALLAGVSYFKASGILTVGIILVTIAVYAVEYCINHDDTNKKV